MAEHITGKPLPHILYSCYSQKSSEGEQFVPEHIFGYTLSGSSETYMGGKTYVYRGGRLSLPEKKPTLKVHEVSSGWWRIPFDIDINRSGNIA